MTNIITFVGLEDYAREHEVQAIFIGKLATMEQDSEWSALANEKRMQVNDLAQKVGGVRNGGAVVGVATSAVLPKGSSGLISAFLDVIGVRFVDGSEKMVCLDTGINEKVHQFIKKYAEQKIPVKGNYAKTKVIGYPVMVLIGLVVLLFVAIIMFGNGGK